MLRTLTFRAWFLRPYTDSECNLLLAWTNPSLRKEKKNKNKKGKKEIRGESVEDYGGAWIWELFIQAFALFAFA